MNPTVAIIGRPNVGKSTLFNRLVGRRLALVDDEPGVTRDRREGEARLFDLDFTVVDTAGLEEIFDQSLQARMRAQTDQAIEAADLVLFLIDARSGVTPLDEHFAQWLQRRQGPVLVVANKCEGGKGEAGQLEAFGLGLGEPIPFSAEHGLGLNELYDAVKPLIQPDSQPAAAHDLDRPGDPAEEDETVGAGEGTLQLAIIGRPNVGKSTLVNRLIGEDRLLTGPESGITRDAIAVEWSYQGRPIRLFDTAGVRRRSKVAAKLEKLSVADALRAVRFAQVVVLVLDAEAPMEKQDLTLARMVVDEGRALVVAVNKWDLCADREATLKRLRDRLERSLTQVKGLPFVTLSALEGRNLDRVVKAVFGAYEVWNRRLPTAQLNRWLEAVLDQHPPPLVKGRRIRLKYLTQAKARPPTFALFGNQTEALPAAYLRYLENSLRETFDLPGTPIRLNPRTAKNPYGR